jgi:hypothetical protein
MFVKCGQRAFSSTAPQVAAGPDEKEPSAPMRKLLLLPVLLVALMGCRTNESPEGQVDDLQITAQVKSKLASGVGVSSVTNISVNSTNGVVTLSGQVDSAGARAKAEQLAGNVPHVVRVIDNLQVASAPAPAGGE